MPHSMATAAAPTIVALNPFMVPSPRTRNLIPKHAEPRQKVQRYGVDASAKFVGNSELSRERMHREALPTACGNSGLARRHTRFTDANSVPDDSTH